MGNSCRLFTLALATALLTACGSIPGPSSGCIAGACPIGPSPLSPSTSATAATATDHGWTTSASIDAARRALVVNVRATGPLSVEGGCVPSLTAWAVGPDNRQIEASPSTAVHCNAISVQVIAAGKTAAFITGIPLPPSGTYTIHGLLRTQLPLGAGMRVSQNIPVVTVAVP